MQKNKLIIALLIIFLAGGALGFYAQYIGAFNKNRNIDAKAAKVIVEKYIKDSGYEGITVGEIKNIGTMFIAPITYQKQAYNFYLSWDGKILFQSGIVLDEMAQNTTTQEPAAEVTKSDKPKVELFVMSYCPYGVQVEKGIAPVIAALGDTIDYELKFVAYVMHGEKEVTENLFQYCVKKQSPEKFNAYVDCFAQDSNSERCIAETGLNTYDINTCTVAADAEFNITKNYQDNKSQSTQPFNINKEDNDKYGVQGSPTLIINGTEISSGRSPAALLTTICSAFTTQPEACKTVLSTEEPVPGFGTGTQSSSGSTDPNCAQ